MPSCLSESMVALLTDLLQPNAQQRLSSLDALKEYKVMKEVDFDNVEKQLTTAKFTPSNNKLNCDPTYELEEIMIESNPLHKKKRRKRKKSQVILREFLVFCKGSFQVTWPTVSHEPP